MSEHNPNPITPKNEHATLLKNVLQLHMSQVTEALNSLEEPVARGYIQQPTAVEQPAASLNQYDMPAQPVAIERILNRVGIEQNDGQIIEVDISQFSADDPIHRHVRPIVINSNGEFEFEPLSIKDQLPASFTASSRNSTIETRKTRRQISRKAKILAGGVLAVSLGGGVAAVAVPGVLPGQNTHAAIAPGADQVMEEEIKPEGQLTARDIAIGDCLDDAGNGKALMQGKVSIDANMKWKIKKIDGTEVVLKDVTPNATDPAKNDEKFPKLTISDATVNTATCIPADVRNDAVAVNGDTVKINWDKVEMQIGIVPGATLPVSDAWEFEPVAGVTDQATVADIIASMNDRKVSASIATPIAQSYAAAHLNKDAALKEKVKTTMKERLIADVQVRVAGLFAAKKSQVEKVNVEFAGTQGEFTYKGAKPVESSKFAVSDINAKFNFDPPANK